MSEETENATNSATDDALTNYTIPKKSQEESSNVNVEPTPVLPTEQYQYTGYGNYTPEMYSYYYNYWAQQQQHQQQNLTTSYNHIQGGTNLYTESLKRKFPATVTASGITYKESFHEVNDPTLPKELTAMFQPLFCKLCSLQLTSSVVAKLHYKGKNHEKKVRKYLVDHAAKTGEPLHKRAKPMPKKKSDAQNDNDPKYFHCEVCDLPLTGRLHAESHYMGKNHHKVLAGKKMPSGKGYVAEDGKWVRTTTSKSEPLIRDGFGQDFVLPIQQPIIGPTIPVGAHIGSANLHCEYCQVNVTSIQQMEMHCNGQRHRKKLKQLGVHNGALSAPIMEPIKFEIPKDLSVYKTPTGDFYCQTCNLTVNSESQFTQHLGSRKHQKKFLGIKD